MPRRRFGDVVVLLPGITGSVLAKEGRDLFAVTPGAALRGLLSLGRNLQELRINGPDDPSRADLGDGISAPRLVDDVHLIPGFWKIDGYTEIKKRLFAELTLTAGQNWFDFPYDWRRDVRVAAAQLAEQAPRWLDDWRRASGNNDAKLVVLAHSMGGLVARHYLEVLGGWQHTRHLVSFGTPYRGSLNALGFLVNGLKPGFGPLSIDVTDLVRSLTSVYQLLPIYPSVALGSGSPLRRVAEIDLPGVQRDRAMAALAFHRDIERANTVNRRKDLYQTDGYLIHPLVGIFQPTAQSARMAGTALQMLNNRDGIDDGGDGTVPRVSATPIELSDNPRETYASTAHASLQNANVLLEHIVGVLTRRSLATFRLTPFDALSVEAPDLVQPSESLPVVARTLGAASAVRVTLTDVDTGQVRRRRTVARPSNGAFAVELPPVPEGVYRLKAQPVEGGQHMQAVTDLVTVLSPATAAAERSG